jgi:hypothetical protein
MFQDYGTHRMTRGAYFQAVLDHLGVRRVQAEEQDQLLAWLTECALEHDKPTLLLQMACEHLKPQHLLRPKDIWFKRKTSAICGRRDLRMSTATVNMSFMWRQHGHVRDYVP